MAQRLSAVVTRLVVLACLWAASAPCFAAAALIGTSTAANPMMAAHKYQTHYANGYYWVAFDTGGAGGSFNSSPDGVTWTYLGTIFSSINPNSSANEWAVRFLGNTVIAASFDGSNSRIYRSGTLNSNGTVTWSAESAVGPADATFNALNLLIANNRPIMWRDDATAGGAGAFWRGSAIASPTWTKTATDAPAMSVAGASTGIFSAGAIFPTGGASPDDLIVLRATTVTPYPGSTGSNRLVAMKWSSGSNTYDASWYNVSTLGGTIGGGETATTEVQATSDSNINKRFAAVRDTTGNLHAVYVNRNGDMVHYKKAVGFNNSWSQVSAGINPPAENINMVALTALPSNNLYLFYSKGDKKIYYRRFDGANWGTESLLQDLSTTNLTGALSPPESVTTCPAGLAFIEGSGTFNIRFTLDVGSCSSIQATEGAGTVTVTAPGSFEMRFNTAIGGGIDQYFDLAEDPARANDLAGGVTTGVRAFAANSLGSVNGGPDVSTDTANVGPKLDLLELTSTRARVRDESFYQSGAQTSPGLKAIVDHSIYPSGKMALSFVRRSTIAATYTFDDFDFNYHFQSTGPLNPWTPYTASGGFNGPGTDAFLLFQNETAGARTDFLVILNKNYTVANGYLGNATATQFFGDSSSMEAGNAWWRGAASTITAGRVDTWNFLTYVKPTNFVNNADAAVTSRSNDYRGPSALTILVGGPWNLLSENTSADDFNEGEGAYLATLDPTLGLTFRIDGSAGTPRYKPFFKIRQWRSLAGPASVTLQGTPLVSNADYRSDVKPVSRAHFARILSWHSTLQSAADVTTPDVGGAGTVNGTTGFAAGRYGNAAVFTAAGANVTFGSGAGNFDKTRGALEFWYRPNYAHTDGVRHVLWQTFGDATHFFVFEKTAANQLLFRINNGGTLTDFQVAPADYSWSANDWVHLRATWDATAVPVANQVHVLVNRVEPVHTGPAIAYNDTTMTVGTNYIGSESSGAFSASGLIDEFHIYTGPAAPTTPTPLADGGLTSSPDEFLADPSKDFSLAFTAIGATGQGRYLYLGADSQFRGLNVALSTPGAGVAAGDLDWEYWNGADWTTLESVGGFTDTTSSFTRSGNVFWQDPPAWAPYSVNGGPDLYYVRVYLKAGSTYTTAPVEGLVKTDILLFQYCGDITAAAQQFVFGAPVTTAVTLQSFVATASDEAVDLAWTTASELQNLGFNVYRADAAEGPYTRLTSALIPGLGASATGQSYSYRDAGLANGRTYHYELEDVETTGKTAIHGPVSATPAATADPGPSLPPDAHPPGPAYGGDPSGVVWHELERTSDHVVLELLTPGFFASSAPDGRVRLSIPGFSGAGEAGDPDVPSRRAFVDIVSGRRIRLASVAASDVLPFAGLRPTAVGRREMEVTTDGSVVSAAGTTAEGPGFRTGYPAQWTRLAGTSFQGETKKAELLLSPLRWDGTTLVLARRLVVRLEFTGREAGETTLGGARGRRARAGATRGPRGRVVAQLVVRDRGLYRVAYEDVFGSAGSGGAAPSSLPAARVRLSRRGEVVAFHVEPDATVFGPGSSLFFLSEGASLNAYGDAAYELETNTPGLLMPVEDASGAGGAVTEYTQSLSLEENPYYQAGLLEAPDLWLWDLLVSPVTKSYPFGVDHVSAASAGRVSVGLQGASDFDGVVDHHVRVRVNGAMVGEGTWDGRTPRTLDLDVAPGVIQEGSNTLELENVGDTGATYSMVFLDRFTVRYPRTLAASGGTLEGRFDATGRADVAGLGASSVVLDTTDTPRWRKGAIATADGLALAVEAGRSYLATATVRRPEVRRLSRSTLRSHDNQADYLLVAPRDFLAAAQPLLDLRASEGLVVKAVSVEEIYEQFGQGEVSPDAIKAFLEYAWQKWGAPSPRYVLLLGDASYDPKDYLKTGVKDWVPGFPVRTSYLWTVSDPAYASVNGDDLLPDLAIGRLPAASVEEAERLVRKTIAFESGGTKFDGRAVLVADNADAAGNFEADADDIASTVLAGRRPQKIYYSTEGANTRPEIEQAFDDGASFLSYVGHGGTVIWASENIFNHHDVARLTAQPRQPFVMTMNCLNGFFHFPPLNSLSEELLKADGKGAIAAFSPSGLSVDEAAHVYHKALLKEILSGSHERLGDAILAAQQDYAAAGAFPELLTIYHLFGDPALRIR